MPEEEIKNETTNAVLKEMIIGLTKITDERLINLKDSVAEIKVLVGGFVTKSELLEVKNDFGLTIKQIRDEFSKHNEDDKTSFEKIDKKQDRLQNIVLLGMGGLAVIVFFIQYILPHYWK